MPVDVASAAGAPGASAENAFARPSTTPLVSAPPIPGNDVLERAGFWPRLGAMALDFLFVGTAAGFLNCGGFLLLVAWLGYHVGFWTWRSTTPGGIILNLRVDRLDGRPMDMQVAVVRTISGAFSLLAGGLGFIWASIDENRQSWHDKIAGTTVVRLRRSAPLV